MGDIILVIIALFILSGFLRRIIFSSVYNAINRAANDFNQKNQQHNRNTSKKQKSFWSKTEQSKNRNNNNDDGEFVDYEEVK